MRIAITILLQHLAFSSIRLRAIVSSRNTMETTDVRDYQPIVTSANRSTMQQDRTRGTNTVFQFPAALRIERDLPTASVYLDPTRRIHRRSLKDLWHGNGPFKGGDIARSWSCYENRGLLRSYAYGSHFSERFSPTLFFNHFFSANVLVLLKL